MGSIFSPATMTPPPPPPLPPAAIPPTFANPAVGAAGARQMAKAGAAMGATNPTGGRGDLTAPPTAKATLLGQA